MKPSLYVTWTFPLVAYNTLCFVYFSFQLSTDDENILSVQLVFCVTPVLKWAALSIWDFFFIEFIDNIFYTFVMKFFSIWPHPAPWAWDSWPQPQPSAEWSVPSCPDWPTQQLPRHRSRALRLHTTTQNPYMTCWSVLRDWSLEPYSTCCLWHRTTTG